MARILCCELEMLASNFGYLKPTSIFDVKKLYCFFLSFAQGFSYPFHFQIENRLFWIFFHPIQPKLPSPWACTAPRLRAVLVW